MREVLFLSFFLGRSIKMYEETKIWIYEEFAKCKSIKELEERYKELQNFIKDEYEDCMRFLKEENENERR